MDARNRQKIFCIGLNKTGTTSFGDALQAYGLRRLGWQPATSSRLMLRWYEERAQPFEECAMEYDVMEDLPWPLVYEWMDAAFPAAKFVLTLRSSTDVWLSSIQQHINRGAGPWFGHRMIYGSYDPYKDAALYKARYEAHNDAVRRHFAERPDKLLELVVGSGDEGERLSAFLGFDRPVEFPHSNKRPETGTSVVPAVAAAMVAAGTAANGYGALHS